MALSTDGFDRSVPLPPGLAIAHISAAIDFVEEKTEDLIELYFEQANLFSAVIGIFGVRALDSLSPYKRHKHPDLAQQRFPDLSLRGRLCPPPIESGESKGSTRPWAIQSHYNHAGWYIVWRYAIDPTKRMTRPASARLACGRTVSQGRTLEVRRQQSGRRAWRQDAHIWSQESSQRDFWCDRLPDPRDRPFQGRPNAGKRQRLLNAVAASATTLL